MSSKLWNGSSSFTYFKTYTYSLKYFRVDKFRDINPIHEFESDWWPRSYVKCHSRNASENEICMHRDREGERGSSSSLILPKTNILHSHHTILDCTSVHDFQAPSSSKQPMLFTAFHSKFLFIWSQSLKNQTWSTKLNLS